MSTILCYFGWEPNGFGSSPLSPGMTAGESMHLPYVPSPRSVCWHFRLVARHPANEGGVLWAIGAEDGSGARLGLQLEVVEGVPTLIAYHDNGSATATVGISGVNYAPGDEFDGALTLSPSGDVHLALSQRGQDAVQSSFSSAAPGLATAWAADQIWMMTAEQSMLPDIHQAYLAVVPEDLTATPGVASATALLRELRSIERRVTPEGYLL